MDPQVTTTHLKALEPYDSDRSDRSRWLIVARRFIWLLLVPLPSTFVFIGTVRPLPYSLPTDTIPCTLRLYLPFLLTF